jgi:hypothetical protein
MNKYLVHAACHADLIHFMMMVTFGEECKSCDEARTETYMVFVFLKN